jgi:hypothetical protein
MKLPTTNSEAGTKERHIVHVHLKARKQAPRDQSEFTCHEWKLGLKDCDIKLKHVSYIVNRTQRFGRWFRFHHQIKAMKRALLSPLDVADCYPRTLLHVT